MKTWLAKFFRREPKNLMGSFLPCERCGGTHAVLVPICEMYPVFLCPRCARGLLYHLGHTKEYLALLSGVYTAKTNEDAELDRELQWLVYQMRRDMREPIERFINEAK
jgi:hypothetical protein